MMRFASVFASAAALLLVGCQKTDVQTGVATVQSSASQSSGANATEQPPVAKDGLYELADVLRWIMPRQTQQVAEFAGLQDYNRFKGPITDIQSGAPHFQYRGRIRLAIDGKRGIAENIEDDYAWQVTLDGANAGATDIALSSFKAVAPGTPEVAEYLRRHRFDVLLLSCFSDAATPTNAEAMYLLRAEGRAPVLFTLGVSTGSGGVFLTYKVSFGPVAWGDVPGATKSDIQGMPYPLAGCPMKEFH